MPDNHGVQLFLLPPIKKKVRQYYRKIEVKLEYRNKTNKNTEWLNKTEIYVLLFIFHQSNV